VPTDQYTVFVHLLDEWGQLWGQGDGPPVNGDYPTIYWESGELIVDQHLINVEDDVPLGDYSVAVGLYHPEKETRLPVWDEAGLPQPQDRVVLPSIISFD